MDRLNKRESAKLAALLTQYYEAQERKDYATSDRLRADLLDQGADLEGMWQSIYESKQARLERLAGRYVYGD